MQIRAFEESIWLECMGRSEHFDRPFLLCRRLSDQLGNGQSCTDQLLQLLSIQHPVLVLVGSVDDPLHLRFLQLDARGIEKCAQFRGRHFAVPTNC